MFQRTKLTFQQKKQISIIAKKEGIRKTAKDFGLKPTTIYSWTKKDMKSKSQKKRLQIRGKQPKLKSDQKQLIKKWIQKQNQKGKIVSIKKVRGKISKITNDNWKPSTSTISIILKSLRIVSRKARSRKARQLSSKIQNQSKIFATK